MLNIRKLLPAVALAVSFAPFAANARSVSLGTQNNQLVFRSLPAGYSTGFSKGRMADSVSLGTQNNQLVFQSFPTGYSSGFSKGRMAENAPAGYSVLSCQLLPYASSDAGGQENFSNGPAL